MSSRSGLAIRSLSDITVTGNGQGTPISESSYAIVRSSEGSCSIDAVRGVGRVGQRLEAMCASGWDIQRPLVAPVEVE